MLTEMQIKERENVAKLIDFINLIDEPNKMGCLNLLEAHRERIINAPGSKIKHQAYPGGYVVHLIDTMEFGLDLFPLFKSRNLYFPDFTLSDVFLVLWFHDKEKPWKYVKPSRVFDNDNEKLNFITGLANKFEVIFSDNHLNALKYIHGEGHDYNPDESIQKPLAVFCHICDTVSGRVWPIKA